jgi:hypothetical protein
MSLEQEAGREDCSNGAASCRAFSNWSTGALILAQSQMQAGSLLDSTQRWAGPSPCGPAPRWLSEMGKTVASKGR